MENPDGIDKSQVRLFEPYSIAFPITLFSSLFNSIIRSWNRSGMPMLMTALILNIRKREPMVLLSIYSSRKTKEISMKPKLKSL